MPVNEWVDMENEAIAKMKKGVPLEQIKWEHPGLDPFWLQMMYEKHAPKRPTYSAEMKKSNNGNRR